MDLFVVFYFACGFVCFAFGYVWLLISLFCLSVWLVRFPDWWSAYNCLLDCFYRCEKVVWVCYSLLAFCFALNGFAIIVLLTYLLGILDDLLWYLFLLACLAFDGWCWLVGFVLRVGVWFSLLLVFAVVWFVW